MFNKKKKSCFIFLDTNDKVIFEGEIEDIKLREEIILKKSEEFFNDSDPCYIHKGAVMARLYSEIRQEFINFAKEISIPVENIPSEILSYINQNEKIKTIKCISL